VGFSFSLTHKITIDIIYIFSDRRDKCEFNLHKYHHGDRVREKEETMAFKDRLKEAMELGGYSQASLAKATGMAQSMIWKLVSGKAKGTSKVVDIASVLGVRPEWLSEGTGPMKEVEKVVYYDSLFPVEIYSGDQATGQKLAVPDQIQSDSCKAYHLSEDSGCAEAPAGTYIVVDESEDPGNKDLVYADTGGQRSVYRFLRVGANDFLSVDDSRAPLIPVGVESVTVLGVIVYLLRGLKRR
jgi:SOS-response transcriptional repressor LexA